MVKTSMLSSNLIIIELLMLLKFKIQVLRRKSVSLMTV